MINLLLMFINMEVSTATIGLVDCLQFSMPYFCSVSNSCFLIVCTLPILLIVVLIFIILSNDVEVNPGPNSPLKFGHLNVMMLNGLEQMISEPKWVTLTTSTNLDLSITNCSNEFFNMGILTSPLNCDHSVIFGEMVIALHERHCFKRDVWNFSHVNTVNLNRERLQVDWPDILDSCFDVDLVYQKWYHVLRQTIEKYIPTPTRWEHYHSQRNRTMIN